MSAESFWDDCASRLQHALVYNLLTTASHDELVRLAGPWFGEMSTNTRASTVAVLKARLDADLYSSMRLTAAEVAAIKQLGSSERVQ